MDNLVLMVYLAGIANNVGAFLLVLGILCLTLVVVFFVFAIDRDVTEEQEKQCERLCKIYGVLTITLFTLSVFTPNKDTAHGMVAAHGVVSIAQTEQFNETGKKALAALNSYLDQYTPDDVSEEDGE